MLKVWELLPHPRNGMLMLDAHGGWCSSCSRPLFSLQMNPGVPVIHLPNNIQQQQTFFLSLYSPYLAWNTRGELRVACY